MGNDSSHDGTLQVLFGIAATIILATVLTHWLLFEYFPNTSYAYPVMCLMRTSDGKLHQQKEPFTVNGCVHIGTYAYISGRVGFRVFPETQKVIAWYVEDSAAP